MSANRDFKGIWIPKEIWLSNDLTALQKLFLAEIDSLDNEFGCTANNHYFADFFNCSESSASKTINILFKKGYIITEYAPNSSRVLRMKKSFSIGGSKKVEGGSKKVEGGSKKVEGGSKKVDHNNTFNNTFNNTLNNQQQKNENFEKIDVVADPDNESDNDLHAIDLQQEAKEYKPFGVKSLNEVLGKSEPKKETPKIEKQIKNSALSNVYDFNSMKFEDIADLLFSFNGNKLRELVIRLNHTTNENFKDAVCAFLLQTTATEKIEHLTEKDLAKHFSNWCNKVGRDTIEEKAKQYKKSANDINCKIDIQDAFKSFQADLRLMVSQDKISREKALIMAENKKYELGII